MIGRHRAPLPRSTRIAFAMLRGTCRAVDESSRALLACAGVITAGVYRTPHGLVVGSWLISQALLLTYRTPEET